MITLVIYTDLIMIILIVISNHSMVITKFMVSLENNVCPSDVHTL